MLVQSSGGPASTVLDGGAVWPPPVGGGGPAGPQQSVVTFKNGEGAGAVLDGFTVQHGRGTLSPVVPFGPIGSGIYVTGASPTLRNLLVRENVGDIGVGMYFEGSLSSVSDCTIQRGTGAHYISGIFGLGIYSTSAITVERCTISDNGGPGFVGGSGGGIYASAGTFTNCQILDNIAWEGAGAYLSGSATIDASLIQHNWANSVDSDPGRGAGVYGGTVTNSTIQSNFGAHAGGGALLSNLTNCVVRGNSAQQYGSSILNPYGGGGAALSTLTDCEVSENVAGVAGFLGNPSTEHPAQGGGLFDCVATRTRIHDNVAYSIGGNSGFTGRGGGGAVLGTLTDCDIHDNRVLPTANFVSIAGGGGIFGSSATRCRLWGNTAPHGGGAANAILNNCTLSANTATISGGGLATVFGTSTSSAHNCILWGDSAPETAVITGTLAIDWSDVDGGFAGSGNINADPLFQSAPNHDYHLLAGSPCIDSGDPAQTDPDSSRIDMGAYPFECEAHTYCVGKVNSLGCIPTAGFTGTAAYSGPDNFHVTGVNIRKNALGMLLWSRSSNAAPFFNGTLCVGQPFFRAGIQNSGGTGVGPNCTGTYDFYFSNAYMNSRGILPFDTIFAQWYMRDATHPDGTSVGVSDAGSLTVCA